MQEEIYKELWDRENRDISIIHKSQKINQTNNQDHPDAKAHQLVSFVKSGIRIIGYVFIPFNLWVACFLLILSEIVGIYEELV